MVDAGGIDLGELILAFIVMVVGLAFTGPMAEFIAGAVSAFTAYTGAATLIPIIALAWVIMLVCIPVVVIIRMIGKAK